MESKAPSQSFANSAGRALVALWPIDFWTHETCGLRKSPYGQITIENYLCVCCHPLMQVRIPFLGALFGLLLVSAIPSYAQTDGRNTPTSAVEDWKKKVVIQLVSKKEFPPGATGAGTAKIKFAFDRQGKLIFRELVESTGSELLDAAALRMIERAAPFPEPPAEVKDDGLTFTVPVIFAKRKQLPWAGGQWPAEWVEEQNKVGAKIRGICRGC